MNFLNDSAAWTNTTWTYRTTFSTGPLAGNAYMLVFDGVKMGARVLVNGILLGTTTDQFLRYTFALNASVLIDHSSNTVGTAVTGATHTLELVFDPAISCNGRWMACTGGWDW